MRMQVSFSLGGEMPYLSSILLSSTCFPPFLLHCQEHHRPPLWQNSASSFDFSVSLQAGTPRCLLTFFSLHGFLHSFFLLFAAAKALVHTLATIQLDTATSRFPTSSLLPPTFTVSEKSCQNPLSSAFHSGTSPCWPILLSLYILLVFV